mmetsp:Transcript_67511/g.195447  ORF Transcript_67511/g.195447 Transcript_67511/m.195447 type:complete len:308 (-) Transcript_67511:62-985(-)
MVFARPPRSSAQRRAQRLRAEGRAVAWLAAALGAADEHRGGRSSRGARRLREALWQCHTTGSASSATSAHGGQATAPRDAAPDPVLDCSVLPAAVTSSSSSLRSRDGSPPQPPAVSTAGGIETVDSRARITVTDCGIVGGSPSAPAGSSSSLFSGGRRRRRGRRAPRRGELSSLQSVAAGTSALGTSLEQHEAEVAVLRAQLEDLRADAAHAMSVAHAQAAEMHAEMCAERKKAVAEAFASAMRIVPSAASTGASSTSASGTASSSCASTGSSSRGAPRSLLRSSSIREGVVSPDLLAACAALNALD